MISPKDGESATPIASSPTSAPRRGPSVPEAQVRPRSVTVVIPSYNGARVIDDAIASVCDQTGIPWDLVVVDDASTDGSLGLLSRRARSDPRMTVVQNDRNRGISTTLNRGIRLATGAFVLILHQDCCLESSDWLSRAVDILRANGSICLAGTPHHDATRMPRSEKWFWITRNHIYSQRARSSGPFRESLFSENKCDLFDTEFLRSLGGFDERMVSGGEDQLLAELLARRGVRVVRDAALGFSLSLGEATSVRQNLLKDFGYGQQMRAILRLVGGRAVRRTPDGGVDRRFYNRVFGVAWVLATVALLAPTFVWALLPTWVLVLPALARALELEARAARVRSDYYLTLGDLATIPWTGLLSDTFYLAGLVVPPSPGTATTPA